MKKVLVALLAQIAMAPFAASASDTMQLTCPDNEARRVVDGATIVVGVNTKEMPFFSIRTDQGVAEVRNTDYESKELTVKEHSFQFSLATLSGRFDRSLGPDRERLVFSGPGHYELYFAENIETEPENTINCSISIDVTAKAP